MVLTRSYYGLGSGSRSTDTLRGRRDIVTQLLRRTGDTSWCGPINRGGLLPRGSLRRCTVRTMRQDQDVGMKKRKKNLECPCLCHLTWQALSKGCCLLVVDPVVLILNGWVFEGGVEELLGFWVQDGGSTTVTRVKRRSSLQFALLSCALSRHTHPTRRRPARLTITDNFELQRTTMDWAFHPSVNQLDCWQEMHVPAWRARFAGVD